MKKQFLTTLAASLAITVGAQAQGLLSIGQTGGVDDFESRLPFTTTIGVDFGWDSNIHNLPDDIEQDSAYVRGGINTAWANGSRTTNMSLNAGFSTIYYFDQPFEESDDTYYSARLGFNIHHRVNRRLTIGNNFYLSYEIEPDNAIGASASRRLDQYLYGYNSTWLSYAWTRRFSTVTRYTLTGIDYEDYGAEDRVTHTFSQELRYVLNRLTTLVGEYRYANTDYDSSNFDYDSHYALAGVDYVFSDDLRGTLRGGAEHRNFDAGDDDWKPYLETSLRYAATKRTNLVWFNRIGYSDSELTIGGPGTNNFSYQSSLSAQHQFTERLRGHAGITYVYDDYSDGAFGDLSEDSVSLSLGVGYRIFSNIDLNAGYQFTWHDSDDPAREYDRHILSAGMSVTF